MIKAIETRYKGYRFRSRLEARWAVFFDALGYNWEYEPEGFHLSDGRMYLPDFRVKSKKGYMYWYEIKPKQYKNDGKLDKFRDDFFEAFGENCEFNTGFLLLSGDPWDFLGENPVRMICPRCGGILSNKEHFEISGSAYWFCFLCDMNTPGGSGNDPEPGVSSHIITIPYKGWVEISDRKSFLLWQYAVSSACSKARSARFEHGESP